MSGLSAEYILKHDSKPPHCFSAFVQGKGYVGNAHSDDGQPNADYQTQLAKRRAEEIENMQFASEYAEPGYENPKQAILFANWNCFSRKVSDVLEHAGYSVEWSDEWAICDDCGKAVRTEGNGYDWTPYYVIEDGSITCLDCIDWPTYLESIEDSSHKACLPQCDPAEHGYVLLSDHNETGLHTGMDADPKKMLKELHAKGKKHIVFRIADKSQFYMTWEAWQKAEETEEAE